MPCWFPGEASHDIEPHLISELVNREGFRACRVNRAARPIPGMSAHDPLQAD
jgi:hypothetical protein